MESPRLTRPGALFPNQGTPYNRKPSIAMSILPNTPTSDATDAPFGHAAPLYRAKGWPAVLPLPKGRKNPPPVGFTGKRAPYPDDDRYAEWIDECSDRNICVRLGDVDDEHELGGIDVDDYVKGGKKKNGGAQLKALEAELGPLPPTYISSSRTDGFSGKRIYRVPKGLAWRGQVDKDVECISKGYRFAAVWPSFNPDSGDTETWFPPGAPLTKEGRKLWDGEIPNPATLPVLPDAWIDYLTHKRMKDSGDPIDMDSSPDEIYAWADATFPDGQTMCALMQSKVGGHLKRIAEEATSHDKLTNAHMNIFHLAAEGHSGWNEAVNQVENCFKKVCQERDKRSYDELKGEIFRSRINGLRKVKGQCDERLAIGAAATISQVCACNDPYPDQKTFAKFLANLTKLLGPKRNKRAASNATGNRPELYDAKISEYIAARYLTKFCYSGALGWMRWTGKHWRNVGEPVVTEAVRLAVLAFHREETNLFQQGSITADRLTATAKLLSANRIASVVRLAKGYLSVADERWDAHPDLLNCANGVVDLRTGALRDHDPALMLTRMCPTEYHSGATHPDWTSALEAVPNDARQWLRLRFGQGVTGHAVPDDVLVLLKGDGDNGKTTLIGGIQNAIGPDFAIVLSEKALLARPSDHSTELMPLRGARLALIEELPELGHLNVKRLKTAFGTEKISARLCRQDLVTFDVTHSGFITTNYLPRVDESDHGTWRRLRAVNFPYRYRRPHETLEKPTDRHGDPGLRDRIKSSPDKQHEAILAWLVDGATAWYKNKRTMPADPRSVTKFTKKWRNSADAIARFWNHELISDPGAHVMTTDLYWWFEQWQKRHGRAPWSDQTFTARFIAHETVAAAGVGKQYVRRSRKGLARPELIDTATPKQFMAWLGVRFRREDDPIHDDEETAL
jgi:putative DNA primase/helicase